MNKTARAIARMAAVIVSVFVATASASSDKLIGIKLQGGGVAADASGRIIVINNESGVDTLLMRVRGLNANTRYTLFITESDTLGALPAQFLGEFTTNRRGKAKLTLITEIGNAFASANQILEDDFGIADTMGAGGIANGANTIALNWLRVYLAEGGFNVFGGSEDERGGGLVLTSEQPLP